MPDILGPPPRRVAILVSPIAAPGAAFGMFDVLASVGRDWETLTGRPVTAPLFEPRLVSADGAGFFGPNGVWIQPHASFAGTGTPDVVCVPDLFLDPRNPTVGERAADVAWLRACFEAGTLVCSVCSGALLLAEAGLLDGGEATTHWGFVDALRRRYPRVTVCGDRILVPSGPGHRVITAGGASSWADLLLYLIARFDGPERAREIAKVFLLQWHGDGQLPFASLSRAAQHTDAAIGACQEWLADHYRQPGPVTAMIGRSGLPGRTFKRRFKKATGLAPLEYVQNLRLEEAKQVLETTGLPIEEVAAAVGYEDIAFFRRLFRRRVGLTPAAYRRRFQGVGRLAEAVAP